MYWLSVKSMLGQNCQMFVSMRAKKPSWDKTAIFLSVWKQKNKQNNQRTKLSIYILDTIESESTTRFKNRSLDRMMTSDWLVDVSDDRCTTTTYAVCIVKWFFSYYYLHIQLLWIYFYLLITNFRGFRWNYQTIKSVSN